MPSPILRALNGTGRARRLLALALILLGCATDADPLPEGGVHVLFVGNSLTYTNDLPATVAAIAASAGDTVRVASETGPNLALIDHLNGATHAADQIKRGGWQFVVLQQGPTSFPGLCRDSLILWTRMFDQKIRAAGGVPALMMVWPDRSGRARFDDVRESFSQAAAAVGGVFLPAGEAWRSAWREDSALALYGPDGFHPSPMGTFLAGLEIYERISSRDPRTLPAAAFSGAGILDLPETTIRLLQRAAHEANTNFPAHPSSGPAGRPAALTRAATC